jgi:hypothetical protein
VISALPGAYCVVPAGNAAVADRPTRPERSDQRFEVGADLVELAEQLAHGVELGGYLVKAVVNDGKPSRHVVMSVANRLADGIRAHGVVTRCAIRVGLVWVAAVG